MCGELQTFSSTLFDVCSSVFPVVFPTCVVCIPPHELIHMSAASAASAGTKLIEGNVSNYRNNYLLCYLSQFVRANVHRCFDFFWRRRVSREAALAANLIMALPCGRMRHATLSISRSGSQKCNHLCAEISKLVLDLLSFRPHINLLLPPEAELAAD